MIQKPQLPPVQGYVEVDVDGVRMYREISTGRLVAENELTIGEEPEQGIEARVTALEAAIERGLNL